MPLATHVRDHAQLVFAHLISASRANGETVDTNAAKALAEEAIFFARIFDEAALAAAKT